MTGMILLPFSTLLGTTSASSALRLPGILALVQAWALLTVVLLQVSGWWPVSEWMNGVRIVNHLGEWADRMTMADVCWNIFMSVCLSIIGNNVARGLEQRSRFSCVMQTEEY
jgi:hypothetical protein